MKPAVWLGMFRTPSGSSTVGDGEKEHRKRTNSIPDALLVDPPTEEEQQQMSNEAAKGPQSTGQCVLAPTADKERPSAAGDEPLESFGLSGHGSQQSWNSAGGGSTILQKKMQSFGGATASSSQGDAKHARESLSFRTTLSLQSKASLSVLEEELSRPVPELLETMNHASSEVNTLEQQACDAQVQHRQLLERWTRVHEELRAENGAAFDKARPYFDAVQVLSNVSERVQAIVREFSAATSQHEEAKGELRGIERSLRYGAHRISLDGEQQDGLSRATVRVMVCQEERDRREQEYARTLREYTEAQEAAEAWKSQIGESVIRRLTPCFRRLQQQQSELAAAQARVKEISARLRGEKGQYASCLRELERINIEIHAARKAYEDAVGCTSGVSSSELSAPWDDDKDRPIEKITTGSAASVVFGDDDFEPSALSLSGATLDHHRPGGMAAATPPPEVSPEVPSDGEKDDCPFS